MSLLQMSVSSAVLILAVVVVRALAINRLPKLTFLALWGIVLCRLLIPVSIPSPLSFYSLMNRSSVSPALPQVPTGLGGALSASALSAPPTPTAAAPEIPWLLLWFIGFALCVLFFAIAYWRCCRKFAVATPVHQSSVQAWQAAHPTLRRILIRQSDRIAAPLTYGLLHPVILLPLRTDWDDLRQLHHILAHEYTHIRRCDALWKLLLIAALCVHWFNPLVWVMLVLANRDLELSCDEAVVHAFGESTRAAYARTLIGMEEQKGGFMPLCNSFSKNAIEERITAIMKFKKTSVVALVVALVLVGGVTSVFATSAPNKDIGIVTEEYAVMSRLAANGKSEYSTDNGKTWMSQSEWEASQPKVEWWTYEGYKAWIAEEKINLNAQIGTGSKYQQNGKWVSWTRESVDETIAMYEAQLAEIKKGAKLSKSVDGGSLLVMMVSAAEQEFANTKETAISIVKDDPSLSAAASAVASAVASTTPNVTLIAEGDSVLVADKPTQKELLDLYGKYGVSFDKNEKMLFNGKRVRYFSDSADVGDGGVATRYEYYDESGTVDALTQRKAVKSSDGSTDPFGTLTGIKQASQADFDKRDFSHLKGEATITATAVADASSSLVPGHTMAERFAKYQSFGLVYSEEGTTSGQGKLTLNGQSVASFIDEAPSGAVFTYQPLSGSGLTVRTTYDASGKLTGLKKD